MYSKGKARVDAPEMSVDDNLWETLYGNAPVHTASQRRRIRSLAFERLGHIQDLDAKMEHMSDACLSAERAWLMDEYRVCYMALNSPIRALPSEILGEIFDLCAERIDWPPRTVLNFLPPMVSSKLRVTWICRRWRQIAHETPWLWRELPLGWRIIDRRRARTFVKQWLARAKNLPLTYTIAARRNSKGFASRPRRMRKFLGSNVLFPTSRVRQLRLVGFEMDIILPLSALPPHSFPLLEELLLNFMHESQDTATPTPNTDAQVVAFADSSRLTALHLGGYVPETVFEGLPLSRVTSLRLQLSDERANSRKVLRRCTNLTYLRLHRPRDPQDSEGGSLIVLRQLETLDVYETANDAWKVLSTPNPKNLRWAAGNCEPNEHVIPFLRRAPSLLSLTWVGICVACFADDIRTVLRVLPCLESLELRRCNLLLNKMYDALTVDFGEETLLPGLRSLTLDSIKPPHGDPAPPSLDAFSAMMHSRRAMSDASLTRQLRVEVNVLDFVEPDDDIQNILGGMEKEGLDLHFG